MPMVVMKLGVNESSLNLRRQHDLPTPESPIKRSFICTMEAQVNVDPSLRYLGMGERGGGGREERREEKRGGAYQEVIVPISGHYL